VCRAAGGRSQLHPRTGQLGDGLYGDGSWTTALPKGGGEGVPQREAEVVRMGREKRGHYMPAITLPSSTNWSIKHSALYSLKYSTLMS